MILSYYANLTNKETMEHYNIYLEMKNHLLLPVEDETIDDTLHSSKHPETATKREKNYKNYMDTG